MRIRLRSHFGKLSALLFLALAVFAVWFALPAVPRSTWMAPEPCMIGGLSADGLVLVTAFKPRMEDIEKLQIDKPPKRGEVIRIWDAKGGVQKSAICSENGKYGLEPGSLSPDGTLLAFVDPGQSVSLRVVDTASGERVVELPWCENDFHDARWTLHFHFSPDSGVLAYTWMKQAGGPFEVRLWNRATRGDPKALPDQRAPFQFAENSQSIVTSTAKPNADQFRAFPPALCVWEVDSGRQLGRVDLPHLEEPYLAAVSTDGGVLAAAIYSEKRELPDGFWMWQVSTGQELLCRHGKWHIIPGSHSAPLNSPQLAESFQDGGYLLLDLATGKEKGKLTSSWGAAVLMDGACFPERIARCAPDGRTIGQLRDPQDEHSPLLQWIWNLCPQLLPRKVPRTYEVELWDVAAGRELLVLPGREDFTFSADGKFLAIQRDDQTIEIWDIPPRKPLGWFLAIAGLLLLLTLCGFWWQARRRKRKATAMTPAFC